ncbi:MAG: hypothetical protein U1B78_07010 [Dehalococcoidia bacterium]|nr:hypothetical protein [Dehalococcoidia bacterium]
MRSVAVGLRRTVRFWILAIVAFAIVVALEQGDPPVQAQTPGAKLVISESNTLPVPVNSIFLVEDSGQAKTFYVWVVDVVGPSGRGAGSFQVGFDYVSWLLTTENLLQAAPNWLESTGRSMACAPAVIDPQLKSGNGYAYVGCNTFGPPPPNGPQGAGLVASFIVSPGSTFANTTLRFDDRSLLTDTGKVNGTTVTEPQEIPLTAPTVPLTVGPCADFNGDNLVDLFNDIFGIALRFGMSSSDPNWDPVYDLNQDGVIDLFIDIFGTAAQFGLTCPTPPPP